MKRFFLVFFLVVVGSAHAATYYVDFVGGNNANNGTSTSTPWKHAPGMQGATGGPASYSCTPGDTFVLKGGVSWDKTAMVWSWTCAGSSGSLVTIGSGDRSWFADVNFSVTAIARASNVVTLTCANCKRFSVGQSVTVSGVTDSGFNGTFTVTAVSDATFENNTITYAQTGADTSSSGGTVNGWTRPLLDANYSVPASNKYFMFINKASATAMYLVVKDIEFTRLLVKDDSSPTSQVVLSGVYEITFDNVLWWNFGWCTGAGTPWADCTVAVNDMNQGQGGLYNSYAGVANTPLTNTIVQNSVCDNSSQTVSLLNKGTCFRAIEKITNTVGKKTTTFALHGCRYLIGSRILDVGSKPAGWTVHENICYSDTFTGVAAAASTLDAELSGNVIWNPTCGDTCRSNQVLYPNPGTSGLTATGTATWFIFNNVVSSGFCVEADNDQGQAGQTSVIHVYGNTCRNTGEENLVVAVNRPQKITTLNVENNHFISSVSGTGVDGSGATTTNTANNIKQEIATANNDGYTTASFPPYKTTSARGETVNKGVDLSSVCASCALDILGVARGSVWDAGAFEWAGASASVILVNAATGGNVTGTGVPSCATAAANHVAGNALIYAERHDTANDDPLSVADVAGNLFTKILHASLGASDRLTVWYAKNILAHASNVVTATYAANRAYVECIAPQYQGLDTAAPLDTSASGTASGSTSVTTGAFSTSQNDELSVCFASVNALSIVFTNGTGYVKRVNISTMAMQDQLFSAVQTSVTAGMSKSGTSDWEMVCAVVKVAALPPSGGDPSFVRSRRRPE